jgi:hypothetical protein
MGEGRPFHRKAVQKRLGEDGGSLSSLAAELR